MFDMEDEWKRLWSMAAVNNIYLGAPGVSSLTKPGCANSYSEHFQWISTNVYAKCPQVSDSCGNLSPMGYAKHMESKMLPFMSSTERPRQDPCPRHFIAFLLLPGADGTTDNDQGGNNSGYFEKSGKKAFLEAPMVFLHLLQLSIVLWTTLVVVQNKCNPKPGLPPRYLLSYHLTSRRAHWGLSIKVWQLLSAKASSRA